MSQTLSINFLLQLSSIPPPYFKSLYQSVSISCPLPPPTGHSTLSHLVRSLVGLI